MEPRLPASRPPLSGLRPHRRIRDNSFRAGRNTSLPEAKSHRRDDGRGQTVLFSVAANDHAQLDWPASSSSNPIRWRPYADHGQKSDPAKGQRKKGIDYPRPVTEENAIGTTRPPGNLTVTNAGRSSNHSIGGRSTGVRYNCRTCNSGNSKRRASRLRRKPTARWRCLTRYDRFLRRKDFRPRLRTQPSKRKTLRRIGTKEAQHTRSHE